MASFEMKRYDESAQRFMVTERSVATARLVAAQQGARQSAYHRNVAAAREDMAAVERRRQEQEDHAGTEVAMVMASQSRYG
jgi:hypothetical protein